MRRTKIMSVYTPSGRQRVRQTPEQSRNPQYSLSCCVHFPRVHFRFHDSSYYLAHVPYAGVT